MRKLLDIDLSYIFDPSSFFTAPVISTQILLAGSAQIDMPLLHKIWEQLRPVFFLT
jgi:hypothetical protein